MEATCGIDSLCMSKRSDRHSRPKSNYHEEASMNAIYYIGLDIHKKTIAYCVKKVDGTLVRQGTVNAERKVGPDHHRVFLSYRKLIAERGGAHMQRILIATDGSEHALGLLSSQASLRPRREQTCTCLR